jgi:hypothetical protein
MNVSEICQLAQNIARNRGWPVFPMRLVGNKKLPTRSEEDGGHGFHDATTDPAQIAWLWEHWPGELIGIRTGEASGISVLDVDPSDNPDAWLWWEENHARLPATRTWRSRRPGGIHLYFRHREGIGTSRGNLPIGCDVRGQGGCIIAWFACIGSECLDHSLPAPWPDWLFDAIAPKPKPVARPYRPAAADPSKAIDGLLRKFANAPPHNRNPLMYWTARRLAEHGVAEATAGAMLLPIWQSHGHTTKADARECKGTIRSAYRRAAA